MFWPQQTTEHPLASRAIHGVTVILAIKAVFKGLVDLFSFIVGLSEAQTLIFVEFCAGIWVLSIAAIFFAFAVYMRG